ncbi:copper chaperone [Gracilibacillus ureilyticus]|uniref:Copper chaperone CopZ n=1 Tax=Gracilibacillus ureilyticus TaxID=531814 RepID=A0A1H9U0N1_9BACI|nr:copper chaperone CopZ [Gracilibacillus ureilyticus]SES02761.1 copper chaperone [Gracilibacillus ureilyticus]
MTNTTLNVVGMTCGHCVSSVEGSVGELNGVEAVKVHLDEAKVDVTFDSEKVDLQVIKETIEEQGYDVV